MLYLLIGSAFASVVAICVCVVFKAIEVSKFIYKNYDKYIDTALPTAGIVLGLILVGVIFDKTCVADGGMVNRLSKTKWLPK